MFSAPGVLRPHWKQFVEALDAMGRPELGRRWEIAQRLIRENGVTYNVHGDEQGHDRPWELDALPLLIPAAEWSALAAGLTQRARLLNMILADVYGPQTLLASGDLPAEFVYAHPNFLRPCHRVRVPRDTYLHLYAVHLARSADDGRWLVLADRTQTPSGAGYAVENRIVISRMLPNKFHDCRVQRLASFFISVRETLRGLAAHHRDNPRIVLMSPGPTSATYFEDAYLARYLGYTLVEGGDLTVRDNRVYLKTLGGLIQTDVILRRIADDDCDPLELPGDGGVPGLVASRAQRQCDRGQRAGKRTAGSAGPVGILAATLPPAAGRGVADSVGGNLVVRPAGRSGLRAAKSGSTGDQAGVRRRNRASHAAEPAHRRRARQADCDESKPGRAISSGNNGSAVRPRRC